jgi:hypothetical protein
LREADKPQWISFVEQRRIHCLNEIDKMARLKKIWASSMCRKTIAELQNERE